MDLVFVIGAFENKNVRYGRVEEPAGSADSWKHVILAINLCRSLMIRVSQSWKWWCDDVTKWHRWLPSSCLEVKLMGNHQLVLSFNHVSLPHGLAFLGTTGVWCKEVCWTRRFSESHYMVYTAQLDKWQLTSELSKLWKATRKSGRQFCFIFFSLFFSLLRLTLADNNWFSVVFTFHFISLPFSFGFFFFFSHSSFHLFWFQFFCFMSVGRVYAVKKKPPQGSDFVAPVHTNSPSSSSHDCSLSVACVLL